MADQVGEFSFFQDIQVTIDKRIDIFISIRPMTTKFGKQIHLQDLTQIRRIRQVLVTSLCQDYVTNVNHYISTTTVPMATKISKMVT